MAAICSGGLSTFQPNCTCPLLRNLLQGASWIALLASIAFGMIFKLSRCFNMWSPVTKSRILATCPATETTTKCRGEPSAEQRNLPSVMTLVPVMYTRRLAEPVRANGSNFVYWSAGLSKSRYLRFGTVNPECWGPSHVRPSLRAQETPSRMVVHGCFSKESGMSRFCGVLLWVDTFPTPICCRDRPCHCCNEGKRCPCLFSQHLLLDENPIAKIPQPEGGEGVSMSMSIFPTLVNWWRPNSPNQPTTGRGCQIYPLMPM